MHFSLRLQLRVKEPVCLSKQTNIRAAAQSSAEAAKALSQNALGVMGQGPKSQKSTG